MNKTKKASLGNQIKSSQQTLLKTQEGEFQLVTISRDHIRDQIIMEIFPDQGKNAHFYHDPNVSIELLKCELREKLHIAGMPTDLSDIKPGDGEVCDEFHPIDLLWFRRIHRDTEVLSDIRVVGELLCQLVAMRKNPDLEKNLHDIWLTMEAHANYRVSEINALATAGAASNAGRAAGPLAKVKKLRAIRDIVWQLALEHLRSFPNHIGYLDLASTLGGRANAAIAAAGLASRKKRSVWTIRNDIMAGRDAGIFSGLANLGGPNSRLAN
jgi:hypothetical protein